VVSSVSHDGHENIDGKYNTRTNLIT